ncbi:hypothetical protein [Microbacterium sp. 2FI]|uniref:hypothetical protein n=1 Tax=Microbacterium sp. 2FI TaxID=2502193 RepID=UPI0010F7B700|nr:hypothetical protein [Microbacterium sp. 2FI]
MAATRGRWAGAVLALACALALTACAAQREPMIPGQHAAVIPDEVTVELIQLRSDVAARQVQLRITNGSDDPLTVGDVTVDDPRFRDDITRVLERTSTIPAGGQVDIRLQLPAVECPSPPDGEVVVEAALELIVAGDPAIAVTPLTDPLDVIGPLHERECRAEALTDAASIAFTGFEPSPPGEPATLELTVTPTGDAAATVAGIQTTNLLTFGSADTTAETYPIDLDVAPGDREAVVIALPLVPLRCDAHAVQEDKRGTIFDVEVAVDGEPGEIELAAPEDLRGRILTWVAEWCGFGG